MHPTTDVIQGLHSRRSVNTPSGGSPPSTPPKFVDHDSSNADLGLTRKRDPDALPPRNLFETMMRLLHKFAMGLATGNTVFSLKAGALTVILCLPSFIKHTSTFAYGTCFFSSYVMTPR
jgi:hypothetical protein